MIERDLFENIKKKKYAKLRIPYMGSKQLIAEKLMYKMLEYKPNAKYFVDLCAGGGSLSFLASQMGLQVIYNDKQTDLINFVKYIFERIKNNEKSKFGIFPEEFYNFVDRETFYKHRNENTIFGQFVRICYSFGCNQVGYLFKKEGNLERNKHLMHNVVMFQCEKSLKEFNQENDLSLLMSNKATWNERRLHIKTDINKLITSNPLIQRVIKSGFVKNHKEFTTFKKEEWTNLNKEESEVLDFADLKKLSVNESLGQLEKSEQLQRLKAQNIQFFNLDYRDVIIDTPIDETIVFLDPPYRSTAEYKHAKGFNHAELDQWFIDNKYTCFMSEYNAPFESILEIQKSSLLNNKRDIQKKIIEKLYINRK